MNVTDALKQAGFTPEKSTAGEKRIYEGTYKCSFVDFAKMEDKGFGESIYAQFKINECLEGMDSNSQYPEFKAYFQLGDKIGSKRNGLAKLINGLFSVGIEVNTDDIVAGLEAVKGAEVYISGFKDYKNVKAEDGSWSKDKDEAKQGFVFMTEKAALKQVKKSDAPF